MKWCLCLIGVIIVSLLCGRVFIFDFQVADFLNFDSPISLILWQLRLPRILLALMIGAILGMSGLVMQVWFRNPLADPSLLGTSSAASLGAVLALYYGLASISLLALPLLSIGFSFCTLFLMLLAIRYSFSTLTLILLGICVQSFCGALVGLALNFAPNPHAALEISFWLMGSLADRSWSHVYIVLPFFMIGGIGLYMYRKHLDILCLGEDVAATLGVNIGRTRFALCVFMCLMVGASVSVAGGIGFIGLMVPHLARFLGKTKPSAILVTSGFLGAILLIIADMIVRLLSFNYEMKLGVVTSLIGIPFLMGLLWNNKRMMR